VNLAIDAVVSLMTGARITVILLLGALVAGMLLWARCWIVASMVSVGMAWLLRLWARLHRPDTLQQMEVLEEYNVP
jgi:hypothetical protein